MTNDLGFGNETLSREAKLKRDERFRNAIRNIKKTSYEQLEKNCKASYEAKVNAESALLKAYEEKKLKSKDMIKKAQTVKRERNKKVNKKLDAAVAAN